MALPRLPQLVTVPECFPPSALAHLNECRLRALASQFDGGLSLPRGPAAERGVLFHRLLEDAARGRIPRSGSLHDDARRALDAHVASARVRLARNPATASYADLPATTSALAWRNSCGRMVDAAARLCEHPPPPETPAASLVGRTRTLDLRRLGRLSEVPIRVPSLRISGRIDVLERSGPSQVAVTDYKTGNAIDANGSVFPQIALQLRLYGLALQELLPDVQIKLIVSAGSEHEVPFTPADAAATREWLEATLSPLARGDAVATEGLASPGPACRTCSIRHACSRYLQAAPLLWTEGAVAFSLPLDIWGTVTDLQSDPNGGLIVRLHDAANRLVRVVRLRSRPDLEDVPTGSPVWFFGLETAGSALIADRHPHPRNFHELPGSPLERRAWALAVFL